MAQTWCILAFGIYQLFLVLKFNNINIFTLTYINVIYMLFLKMSNIPK